MSVNTLTIGGVELEAVSVGGLETCIQLPGWNLCFDIGRCPMSAVRRERVFVTHAHMDHAGGLAYHAALRDLLGMKPPTYYVPRENLADFEDLLACWRRLDRSDLPCTLVPVSPGERVDLGGGRAAVAFRSVHRVVCQGYALLRTRHRLLPALAGLPELEIRARRLGGEVVTEAVEAVEVAFAGDTRIEVVDEEPLVRTARLLILEVTFVDDRVSVASARRKGHIHLDEVIERAAVFENEHLLFTHFSARWSAAEIQEILARRLPPELAGRVTPLLTG